MRQALALLLACLMAGALSPRAAWAETLRWLQQSDIHSLDPYSLNETTTLSLLGNVYEGLIRRDSSLKIEPALAESWEQLTPQHWRFRLRQGVTFHNGNPFTAEDVVFSFRRVLAEGSDLAGRIPPGTEIEKVDDHTVDFRTPQPSPTLMAEWASWYIMDEEWARENGAEAPTPRSVSGESFASLNANGTGPFKVVERVPGEGVTLAPFADWWDEAAHNLTEVIYRPVPDGAARVKALLDGEAELIQPVPVGKVAAINESEDATVMAGPELRTIFLGMDQQRASVLGDPEGRRNPFLDARVREAVYLAIDVERIKRQVMGNLSTPAALLISPFLYKPAEEMKRPAYNPERARALLAQAGYAKGFDTQLDCPRDRYLNDQDLCLVIAAMLGEVGVRVTPAIRPKDAFFEKVLAPRYETSFYLFGWLPSSFEPSNVIQNLMLCRGEGPQAHGRFNLGGYCNPEVDRLAAELRVEQDPDQRRAKLDKIFALVAGDWAYVPLHQQGLAWGVSERLEIKQRADDFVVLSKARLR
ncbi:ABC transporter substrate-binding protein [Limibacillus halophilus]